MLDGLLRRVKARANGQALVDTERSILDHLSLLLNTRQGSSAVDPAYGLPDFTDTVHNIPAGIPALQRLIVEAIRRYEPRLRAVSVHAVGLAAGALTLSFEVRAQLVGGGSFRCETRVLRGGQVAVR